MSDIKLYQVNEDTTVNGIFYERGTKVPLSGVVRNCNLSVIEDVKIKDNFKEEKKK